MRLSELYVVEGDPAKGGCRVAKMKDILRMNRAAYAKSIARPLLVLGVAASLEEGNAMRRGIIAERHKKEGTRK